MLPRAKRLRWIQLTSAGAEQLLPARDLLAGIVVTNTRGIHVDLMADYALGVIVMLQWDFPRMLRDQQTRTWDQRLALPLAGRTLGVVGAGAIGAEISRRAAAFGMNVLAIKRTPGPVEGAREVMTADRLREALPRCDFVVLVVPVTEATRGMMGAAELRAMKRTGFLVNIARGRWWRGRARHGAARRVSRGRGLDVFDEEPLPRQSLWTLPNVILTPHVAVSPPTTPAAWRTSSDNVARWRRHEPLRNVVDFERGY